MSGEAVVNTLLNDREFVTGAVRRIASTIRSNWGHIESSTEDVAVESVEIARGKAREFHYDPLWTRSQTRGRLIAWLLGIARKRASDHNRKEVRNAGRTAVLDDHLEIRDPVDAVALANLNYDVAVAMRRLSDSDRKLVAYALGPIGRDYSSLATIFGIDEARARQRVSRAFARLQGFLRDMGYIVGGGQ